jgi:hypothetical protein
MRRTNSRRDGREGRRSGLVARLAAWAGLAESVAAEPLEARQLLFTMAITPDSVDPNTGLGQTRAYFFYHIPYLETSAEPNDQPAVTRTEPFDDDAPGARGSGQFFLGSGMQLRHNIAPAGDISIQPPDQQVTNRWLRVNPNQSGEFFGFEFWNDSAAPTFRTQALAFEMALTPDGGADNSGMVVANYRVTFFRGGFGGTIVGTAEGATLRNLIFDPDPNVPGDFNQDLGVGIFRFNVLDNPVITGGQTFDAVRFELLAPFSGNTAFRVDNAAVTLPAGRNAPLVSSTVRGAVIVLTGPVGASVTVEDLYGRDMVRTIAWGTTQAVFTDLDDNGIPNYNNGIGRIRIFGSDARTSISVWGGEIEATEQPPEDAEFFEQGYAFRLVDNLTGNFDELEQDGFGYAYRVDQGGQVTVTGLPPGPGSVVIGAPYIRSNTINPLDPQTNPYAPAIPPPQRSVISGFTNPNQGIFVESGSIGGILVHGVVHGASRIAGSVDRINIGYLVGSITVEGDLGELLVGSDIGQWSPDPDFEPNPGTRVDQNNKTGTQIIVGRTAGEIAAAGRGMADITIIGDLNSPTTRPPRDVYNYYEKEVIYGVDPSTTDLAMIRELIYQRGFFVGNDPRSSFRATDQPRIFGLNTYRNDTIMSAEWVGSISSGVRIRGELSGQDTFHAEDTNDVFAFAVDGTQEVVIEGINDLTRISPYVRIVDQDGRTLAATQQPATRGRFASSQLRWMPPAAGIYYIVISDPNGNEDGVGTSSYALNITGMAPTTLGVYRTGAGSGFTDATNGEGNSINVLNGSMGSVRVGVGYAGGDGADQAPSDAYNTQQTDDDSMSFQGGAFTIHGTLYNITTGSDIGFPVQPSRIVFRIGGNLGSLVTGLSPVVGGGPGEGDVNFLDLGVGGSIGSIDIRGGIGMDQDETDPRAPVGLAFPARIVTGTAGGRGDIGFIRTGFHIAGDTIDIQTSPGSVIGAFLSSQDAYGDTNPRSGIYGGTRGLPIRSGFGSDVRFVDLIRLDNLNGNNLVAPIIGDQPLELVDDGGARITITVEGAAPGVQVGTVRFLPVDGSQGVAIGQILVDLGVASILRIQPASGTQGGSVAPVSIGRINVTNSGAGSGIEITGNIEVDVYRIESAGPLDRIANRTPGGDIVSAAVGALNILDVRGNIGQTQWTALRPQNIAPFLDINAGLPAGVLDNDYNGTVYRPLNDDVFDTGNAYLDDIGAPMDGWLNGLFVNAGDVQEVRADGAVGDVILGAGNLLLLIANADRITTTGGFDGIVGSIFATSLGRIDIGDGVAPPQGPFAAAGIFALDDIQEVVTEAQGGASLRGVIIAGNIVDPPIPDDTPEGITSIILNAGVVEDAFIAAHNLDAFWASFNYGDDYRPDIYTLNPVAVDPRWGDIQTLQLNGVTLNRSVVLARNISDVRVTGAFIDASTIAAFNELGRISAQGFRNSTRTGTGNEIRSSLILSGGHLRQITAVASIEDYIIDILGSVRESITAANIIRTSVDVDGELKALGVARDFAGSDVNVGSLTSMTVGRNLIASTISVSNRLATLSAANEIRNAVIEITGPSGSVGTISGINGVDAEIASTGPIASITSTAGDVRGSVRITNPNAGLASILAGRDVAITADIAGDIGTITAGRHIGDRERRGVILSRSNIASVSAPNGTLYADLRAGGTIGTVTLGSAINKPDRNLLGEGSIIAFRTITSVTINGDFDGDILSYTGGLGTIAINNGSLLPGNTIAAYDGSIASLIITNGNLYGNVHADYDITLLRVVAGADGVFGDIGVNPEHSQFNPYDARRNRLPAGVSPTSAFQGPRISAGFNIVTLEVTGGSVFESSFVAGREINTITINGSTSNDNLTAGLGTYFVAGDTIRNVAISGSAADTAFIAGLVSFGGDNRPGGTGASADTVKSGTITRAAVSGTATRVIYSAGMNAAGDGQYNTPDDYPALGFSSIDSLPIGSVGPGVSAFADSLSSSVLADARYAKGGTGATNPFLDNGAGTPGVAFSGTQTFTYNGNPVTFTFTGPGQAFFNASTGRLTLRNTTTGSNLTVSSPAASIADLDIISNDDASLGTVSINVPLVGNSDFIIDGAITTANFAATSSTGRLIAGHDVGSWTFASLAGGHVQARNVTTFRINGDFGAANPLVSGEASVWLLGAGTISIAGAARAPVSVDRNAASVAVAGAVDRGAVRVAGNLGTFSAASLSRSVINAGDNLTTVTITGDSFASSIIVGLDLGQDAAFGGSGLAADRLSTGFLGTVTIGGNFRESSIVAGYNRGADGFFGSSDDTLASGRSSIGSVTIRGTQVGSSRNSESYRIASTGTVGPVTIGGSPFSGSIANFALERLNLPPAPVQVSDIRTAAVAGVWTANLFFNQPIDASSVMAALTVYEVRGAGEILQRIAPGVDYTLSYNASANAVVVTFARALSDANLPQLPGRPGPGIYRFFIDQSRFRAKLSGQPIDGNADGLAQANEHFLGDAIVGDAGDKFTATTSFNNGNPSQRVDFYAPLNLDILLDSKYLSDGLPDANRTYTIRGTIGDHPDASNNYFSFASDVDLYAISLQAGQILRLGALSGPALLAGLSVFDPDGNPVTAFTNNASVVSIPVPPGSIGDLTFPQAYLIRRTGTYVIAVGNTAAVDSAAIPNIPIPPNGMGTYEFALEVFDDANSGFTSPGDSGDGDTAVTPPPPVAFAGLDGVFGTADDVAQVVSGSFVFTLNRGPDGLPNTSDDVVSGSNGTGITSTRLADGTVTYTVDGAIGHAGAAGVPNNVTADLDIIHLNGRQPISPGTRIRVTVKLSEFGADLGSPTTPAADRALQRAFADNRGSVQFALFDTSTSLAVDDALLVFSPTDFTPSGGRPNTVLASNGSTTYGYDVNGDFYIDFVAPDRQDLPGGAASFAFYLQGVYNTDYRIEIVMGGSGQVASGRQNVFIETSGGTLSWLQAGGQTTSVAPFLASTLGFAGTGPNGQPAQDYILATLVASLNALYQGAGLNVFFSSNVADFEGEPFSTVYLSSTVDPILPLFDPFNLFNFGFLSTQLITTQPYGFSQHSDPFNANIEDEAVVFVPAFSLLGLTPSWADMDAFAQALTASVSRRVGELIGARLTVDNGQGSLVFDPMAADSVENRPGLGRAYSITANARSLSNGFDTVIRTDFFFGRQSLLSILDKVVGL